VTGSMLTSGAMTPVRPPSSGLGPPEVSLEGLRIVMVEPPFLVPKQFIDYPVFMNLGLLHNAAVLEGCGAQVVVADAIYGAEGLPLERGDAVARLGLPTGELAEKVAGYEPDVVVVHTSFFANPRYLDGTLLPELFEELRGRLGETPLLASDMFVGGLNYFPYDAREVGLRLGARAVVAGETDAVLAGAVSAVIGGAGRDEPLVERADHLSGRFPKDLDALPHPAFHLLDMERYFEILGEAQAENLVPDQHAGERLLPFVSSRGCPYSCIFCTHQVLDLPWRGRSADGLCAELDRLRAAYGVERVLFLDDLMNLDGPRFAAVTRHMAEVSLPWDAVNGLRADRLGEDVLRDMQAAGNRKVTVSAESGDQGVLSRVVKKGLDLSHIEGTARAAAGIGFPCQVHYVLGFPGERREELNNTLLHAARMRRDHGAIPLLQYATPVEGTRLHRKLCEDGLWADPEARDRDPSGLFCDDSVIRDADFDPALLRRMREAFDAAMRALDAAPAELHLGGGKGRDWLGVEEIRRAAEALPPWRREVKLAGAEPLLHPGIPEILEALREAGARVVALRTSGGPLLRGVVRKLLKASGVRQIELDLDPWLRAGAKVREPKSWHAHVVRLLHQSPGLREGAEGSVTLDAVLAEGAEQPIARVRAMVGVRRLSVRAWSPPHSSPDPGRLGDALDALAAAVAPAKLRVEGLPPCALPQLATPGDAAGKWLLEPCFDGAGGAHGRELRRVEACPRCPVRVACPGYWP
jgi:organic radical activating enzyme